MGRIKPRHRWEIKIVAISWPSNRGHGLPNETFWLLGLLASVQYFRWTSNMHCMKYISLEIIRLLRHKNVHAYWLSFIFGNLILNTLFEISGVRTAVAARHPRSYCKEFHQVLYPIPHPSTSTKIWCLSNRFLLRQCLEAINQFPIRFAKVFFIENHPMTSMPIESNNLFTVICKRKKSKFQI